ncbi:hypothetical protein ABZ923_02605 [Streptomyces sp. NPDC046881]
MTVGDQTLRPTRSSRVRSSQGTVALGGLDFTTDNLTVSSS